MSPLWRDEVGIYLAQRRVCLVRMKRGIKPTLAAEINEEAPHATAGWEGALALLDRQLLEPTWSNAQVRVVVADQWVRYAVVPWSDALTSSAERLGHARELMSGIFGAEMGDWTLSLSEAPPGASRLASAMPTALLQALKESAARHGQKIASVQPHLIAAYNSWRHVLPDGAAWFVTVEEGSLAALRMCADGIDRVHAVRIGLDWARELKRLQTFGRLASSSPADGRVYVDLPAALRALRPDVSTNELEWLDEQNPPLTTLHQLEHLRRRAA